LARVGTPAGHAPDHLDVAVWAGRHVETIRECHVEQPGLPVVGQMENELDQFGTVHELRFFAFGEPAGRSGEDTGGQEQALRETLGWHRAPPEAMLLVCNHLHIS